MTQINGGAGNDIIVGTDGGEITDISFSGTVGGVGFSPDGGRLAFATIASDLVPGDTNQGYDVFLLDMLTGALTPVSTDVFGNLGDGPSMGWGFSPDGTKFLLESQATNLVPGDTNGKEDAFIKDLVTGVVTRVSTSASGAQTNGNSFATSFSPDGTKILLFSNATDLVPGPQSGLTDIFVKDLNTGALIRVNTDSSGAFSNTSPGSQYHYSFPQFSPDGAKVLFDSGASNLVAGDTNGTQDIFIKDLASGAVTRINTSASGGQSTGTGTGEGMFSPDGTKVVFQTGASDLGPVDTNGATDVYIKDLVTGVVTLVSTDASGGQADGPSQVQAFLPDGSGLLFISDADNLVPGDTNGTSDVFLKNLVTGVVTRVSVDASGAQLATSNFGALPSPDGTLVGFAAYSLADVGGSHGHYLLKNIGDGSDVITGGAGDDVIDGKSGTDTAVYSGNLADYLVTTFANGVTLVRDDRAGSPDGTDHLTNVELLRFADQTIPTPGPSGPPPTNRPPTPAGDTLAAAYHTPVTVLAASLMANDSDPDGDVLTLTAVAGAQHGTVGLSGGAVTFTPYLGFVGQASFGYTVDDGHGGTSTASVTVNVAGPGGAATAPAYTYGFGATGPETWDFTGDSAYHQLGTGSGYTTVYTGTGGSSIRLGTGGGEVHGGGAKDNIIFGAGVDTATGGGGNDVFILTAGMLSDPTLTGGLYDTVTDFAGAGVKRAPDGDFIYFKGFNKTTATVVYEHDLAGDPTAHLYKISDGVHSGEFVLDYAGAGVNLVAGQFGFL